MTCPPMLPDVPDGLLVGTHVYTKGDTPHLRDGMVGELQTCKPRSVACDNLSDPY